MRIGFFLDSYRPYVSGVVYSAESFADGLRHLGDEVFIIAPSSPMKYTDPYIIGAPSIHTPLQPSDHYLPYPISPTLWKSVKKLNLDIIHTHHMFLLGRLGAAWSKRLGIPLVHTYHTILTEYTHYVPLMPSLAKRIVVNMTRKYCNNCDKVTVPTPQIAPVLRSFGVTADIDVIPTGIDISVYEGLDRDQCRAALGYKDDEFVLICVARLAQEKNPEFVIRAFSKIALRNPNTRLLMVGPGPLADNLKRLSQELGVDDKVTFTGAVAHEAIPMYYKASDLFVYASVTDTQAIVIPEAMASGIPAVAVGAHGVNGMIKNGIDGFLTKLDIDDFTDRIYNLMNDSTRYDLFSSEALASANKLSTKASAIALHNLYEQIISN